MRTADGAAVTPGMGQVSGDASMQTQRLVADESAIATLTKSAPPRRSPFPPHSPPPLTIDPPPVAHSLTPHSPPAGNPRPTRSRS
jgi:hypothetical protein